MGGKGGGGLGGVQRKRSPSGGDHFMIRAKKEGKLERPTAVERLSYGPVVGRVSGKSLYFSFSKERGEALSTS